MSGASEREKCPKCGQEMVLNYSVILGNYPEYFYWDCDRCFIRKGLAEAIDDFDARTKERKPMSGASEREKFVRCVKCGKETCQTTDWCPPCKECGELQHKYICDMPPKPVETGEVVKKGKCVDCAARDAEIEWLKADSRRHQQQLESAEAALTKAGIKMGDRQGALVSVTEGIEELAAELHASQDHAEALAKMYDKMREYRNEYFAECRKLKEQNDSLQSKLAELRACLVEPIDENGTVYASILNRFKALAAIYEWMRPWIRQHLERITKALDERGEGE